MTDQQDTLPSNSQPPASQPLDPQLAILRERLLHAELRLAARTAGMVDLDGIKLLDPAAIHLTETGDLADAPALMQRLKREKPYLFAQSGSSNATPPPTAILKPRSAMEMSLEEWRKARADLLRP